MIIAKLESGKIVEIVRARKRVQFDTAENWLLLNSEPGRTSSLSVRWVLASKVRFTWVRIFETIMVDH